MSEMRKDKGDGIELLSASLDVVSSKPARRVLKAIMNLPLVFGEKTQKAYLHYVAEMNKTKLDFNARQKDIEFQDAVRRRWLEDQKDVSSDQADLIFQEVKKLAIYGEVFEGLHSVSAEQETDEPFDDHWFGIFNNFFMLRNEPWRSELLKNCIMLEAIKPGTTKNKTVFNIAMMEYSNFMDIYDFLSNSAQLKINGEDHGYVWVGYYAEIANHRYTRLDTSRGSAGELLARLEAEGLLAIGDGCINLGGGDRVAISTPNKEYQFVAAGLPENHPEIKFLESKGVPVEEEMKKGAQLFGMRFNDTGKQVARLCTWKMSMEAEQRATSTLTARAGEWGLQTE
ncbi:hypothetical protein [Pseudodesulfovibrio sp.]|uniref:hypothetical protein n=1 Tax=unclassified Pseudodesulfovibrio TaxID=2661612 RepID=UPI003B003406